MKISTPDIDAFERDNISVRSNAPSVGRRTPSPSPFYDNVISPHGSDSPFRFATGVHLPQAPGVCESIHNSS